MFTSWNEGIGYPYKLLGGNISLLIFILIMLIFEWSMRKHLHPLRFEYTKLNRVMRWSIYTLLTLAILWYAGEEAEFIYFQF